MRSNISSANIELRQRDQSSRDTARGRAEWGFTALVFKVPTSASYSIRLRVLGQENKPRPQTKTVCRKMDPWDLSHLKFFGKLTVQASSRSLFSCQMSSLVAKRQMEDTRVTSRASVCISKVQKGLEEERACELSLYQLI